MRGGGEYTARPFQLIEIASVLIARGCGLRDINKGSWAFQCDANTFTLEYQIFCILLNTDGFNLHVSGTARDSSSATTFNYLADELDLLPSLGAHTIPFVLSIPESALRRHIIQVDPKYFSTESLTPEPHTTRLAFPTHLYVFYCPITSMILSYELH